MTVARCPVCKKRRIRRYTQAAPYTERHITLAAEQGIPLDLTPTVTIDCRRCGFTMSEKEILSSPPERFTHYAGHAPDSPDTTGNG